MTYFDTVCAVTHETRVYLVMRTALEYNDLDSKGGG